MSAPTLDFEALLSKDFRPAGVTRLVPREAFHLHSKSDNNNSNGKNGSGGRGSNSNESKKSEIEKGHSSYTGKPNDIAEEETSRLVRKLVATTSAFARHFENESTSQPWTMIRDQVLTDRLILAASGQNGRHENSNLLEPFKAPASAGDLPPSLHEVELGDWERWIRWEGVQEDDNNNNTATTTTADTTTSSTTASSPPELIPDSTTSLLQQRRNPFLDNLVFDNTTVSWEGSVNDMQERARNVPLILELGVAGKSVARHILPPQRPVPGIKSEAYRKRMDLEWTAPITSTAEVSKGSLHTDKSKMEALIEQRQKKRAQMAKDKTSRVTDAMSTLAVGGGKGRTITSSLMGPGGTERTGRPSRHIGSSPAHEFDYVEQLDMVSNHSLVRDLSKVLLRQYHRPKLPMTVVRRDLSWQFQIRFIPTSKKADPANSSSYQTILMGTHAGAVSKAKLRNESDLSPTEGKLVFLEYSEEKPPIMLTKGMASKIVSYYRGDKSRCPVSAGGGDRPTRRKRSGADAGGGANANSKAGKGGASDKIERPPHLEGPDRCFKATVTDWIGKMPKKTARDDQNKQPAIDILPEGVTEILHPKVHGPFIGEVEEGVTQTGLISNLFVAPIFRHEPELTDFLMILGRNSGGMARPGVKESLGVILREIPSSIFTVGQTEPRTRVFAPNTQGEKNLIGPFVSYQIAKSLTRTQHREGHGLRFDEIQDRVLPNLGLPANALRQRLKQVAIYDKNTQIWTTKELGYEDYAGVDALGKSIAPEGVAAYETACAAARYLTDLGIHHLFSGSHSVASVGVTMVYLAGQLNAARELHRKTKKMAEISRSNKNLKQIQVMFYEKAAEVLDGIWKSLRQRHEVSKFIYEKLQLAPWHLTGEFIEVHKKAEGTGMMKLTGLGDPTGQGEGFSFLREVDTKPSKAVGTGALNAQMKKITGTEDDLRKLTMKQMASLLRSYGMAQKQIDTLKRWDRVHVIRDLSTKAASDGIGDGLERFARGEKMKLSEQKQMYRDRIQVIWRRQMAALSSSDNAEGRGAGGGSGGHDTGGVASGSGGGEGGAGETGGKSSSDKARADRKDDSDSESDDDDFAATFEEEMMDRGEANQLVAAHARGAGGKDVSNGGFGQLRAAAQDQDLTKDARELAALKRQREEERAAREGLMSVAGAGPKSDRMDSSAAMTNRKVIRRRVTKTYPDGRQVTTFKYIVGPEEVGKLMAALQQKKDEEKPKREAKYEYSNKERALGHAMFEDEDDFDYANKSRLGVQKRMRGGNRRGRMGGTASTGRAAPRTKTLMGKLKTKTSKEQRMKKRKRVEEEEELYIATSKRKGTNNRRERGSIRDRRPHVIFAERLESIRSMVESRPSAGPFLRPVNRRHCPRYYEVISSPIDLQTIRDKINNYEYRTSEAFLRDFELMRSNAVKFNGSASNISDEGIAIYEAVKNEVSANQEELKKMEEAVKEQLSGKPKKKRKKKVATSKKAPAASATANMSMVGGVEVNLGDLSQNMILDESDSDSDDSSPEIAI